MHWRKSVYALSLRVSLLLEKQKVALLGIFAVDYRVPMSLKSMFQWKRSAAPGLVPQAFLLSGFWAAGSFIPDRLGECFRLLPRVKELAHHIQHEGPSYFSVRPTSEPRESLCILCISVRELVLLWNKISCSFIKLIRPNNRAPARFVSDISSVISSFSSREILPIFFWFAFWRYRARRSARLGDYCLFYLEPIHFFSLQPSRSNLGARGQELTGVVVWPASAVRLPPALSKWKQSWQGIPLIQTFLLLEKRFSILLAQHVIRSCDVPYFVTGSDQFCQSEGIWSKFTGTIRTRYTGQEMASFLFIVSRLSEIVQVHELPFSSLSEKYCPSMRGCKPKPPKFPMTCTWDWVAFPHRLSF